MRCSRNRSIKVTSLFVIYGSIIIIFFSTASSFFYFYSKKLIEDNITEKLNKTTQTILHMVEAATDASIKNRLRGIAEKNYDIANYYYGLMKEGKITEEEAKKRFKKVLSSQDIGQTGYIYVLDSNGNLFMHPKIEENTNLSEFDFIQKQLKLKEGYIEYMWSNPSENIKKPKALYMTYFKPWDLIISVSSYRNEFTNLIKTEDFRDKILSLKFGNSGYSYVMKSNGELIIHPELEGKNIIDEKSADGRKFIQEICDKKNGKIIYPWKNPGEEEARKKLVIFHYIKELDWIVASSSYLEEFYSPLTKILYVSLLTIFISLLFLFILTYYFARFFSKPVRFLIRLLETGIEDDFRVNIHYKDIIFTEIRELTKYFDYFMNRIRDYRDRLQQSKDEYKSIIENAIEGIFRSTPDGTIIKASPAFAKIFGYDSPEDIIENVVSIDNSLYVNPEKRDELLNLIYKQNKVHGFEAEFYKNDGSKIWCSLNARAVKDDEGNLLYIEGFLTDITEKKLNEIELTKSKLNLENRVKERTKELKNTIAELEERTNEQKLIQEMNDMIQVCRNIDESCKVIQYYLGLLFPESSGILYLKDDEKNIFIPKVMWGIEGSYPKSLNESDCWALRRGKIYMLEKDDDKPRCQHIDETFDNCICNVVLAEGDVIGLFHLRFNALDDKTKIKERVSRLVVEFCDNIGLILANLKLREALQLQSLHDPLTGLYNRRYLDDYLEREEIRNKRKDTSIGLLMLDIDKFKSVNDNYGHDMGDEVLIAVANILLEIFRKEDVVCRFGGEEFLIVIPETNQITSYKRAEQVRSKIEKSLEINKENQMLTITVSIGVATIPENGETYKIALKSVDEALYKAKETGRNKIVCAWENNDL